MSAIHELVTAEINNLQQFNLHEATVNDMTSIIRNKHGLTSGSLRNSVWGAMHIFYLVGSPITGRINNPANPQEYLYEF